MAQTLKNLPAMWDNWVQYYIVYIVLLYIYIYATLIWKCEEQRQEGKEETKIS